MRHPHSYVTRFRCPKCKRAGSAKWEESERVASGGAIEILKHLSDGFRPGPAEPDPVRGLHRAGGFRARLGR